MPPAAGRAEDAGSLAADCPVLAEDAGQSALGAALALHAALCGARCPPLRHPETPGSSGPAPAAPAGLTSPAREDVAPGAPARVRGAAGASPAAALGTAGRSGAAALLARAAEAVPLLLDAASEQQVERLRGIPGGASSLWVACQRGMWHPNTELNSMAVQGIAVFSIALDLQPALNLQPACGGCARLQRCCAWHACQSRRITACLCAPSRRY